MKNKKIILGSIGGVILLGIITNALWELLKPLGIVIFQGLLNLSIFGMEKFKDGIYEEVAKGFHEGASVEVLTFINAILFSVALFTVLSAYFLRKRVLINDGELQESDSFLVKMGSIHKKIMKKNLYVWFLVLYVIFFGTLTILNSVKEKYINNSVTHFEQLIKIISPYTSKEEIEKYNSNFAQIKNRDDYTVIINNLKLKVKEHNQEVPNFNFIF